MPVHSEVVDGVAAAVGAHNGMSDVGVEYVRAGVPRCPLAAATMRI